ncbi:unnamed protein product [Tuber aestivum]|uniref:Protein kinase domain-containing protein n=1 Tax=Tuber aestivum TaxID=59557 RepID=A0A292Q1Y6_9PEZI|nr:unnamed protein product [Tuber aestivum]
MKTVRSDLVDSYRLETEFLPNCVRHTNYSTSRRKETKEEWSVCEHLGRGSSSVVYKQVESSTGNCRALKVIDKTRLPAGLDYSRELTVMAVLAKHSLLFVKFLGWFEDPGTLYIAMEYLEMGDLRKHISEPLPQETVQRITKQLLDGLDVMHQRGIAHRDLKPENIFVVKMAPIWVKLGDFGISKRTQGETRTVLHTTVGTRIYSAPEVLGLDSTSETSEYTNAVDIWSLGCVVYELLTGEKLFANEGLISWYFFGKSPFPERKLKSLSPGINDAGISLIKSMVSIQPDHRPSVPDSLGHTWIADLQSDTEDDGESSGEDQNKVWQPNSSTWPTMPKTNPRNTKPQTRAKTMVSRGDTPAVKGNSKKSSKVTKFVSRFFKSSPKPSPQDSNQSLPSAPRRVNHPGEHNSSSESFTESSVLPRRQAYPKLASTQKTTNHLHRPSWSSSLSSGGEGKKPKALKRGDSTRDGVSVEAPNSFPRYQTPSERHSQNLTPGRDSIPNPASPTWPPDDPANETPMPYPPRRRETLYRDIARDTLEDDFTVRRPDDPESSDLSADELGQPWALPQGHRRRRTPGSEARSLEVSDQESSNPAPRARPSWETPGPIRRSSTNHTRPPISTQLDRRPSLSRKNSSGSIDSLFAELSVPFGRPDTAPTDPPEPIASGGRNSFNTFDSYLAGNLQAIYDVTDHDLRRKIQSVSFTPRFDTN